jgi:hypothetical protein
MILCCHFGVFCAAFPKMLIYRSYSPRFCTQAGLRSAVALTQNVKVAMNTRTILG